MIRTELDIAGWHLVAWLAVDDVHADDILADLQQIGCEGANLRRAKVALMSKCRRNHGLTYSSADNRASVLVVGKTTGKAEFLNTLTHEICHLALHISKYNGIDPYSEEVCYIAGDVSKALYPVAELFFCDCHKNKRNKIKI